MDKDESCIVYGLAVLDGPVRYVGYTRQRASQRLYQHRHASRAASPRLPLHRWIKKHGEENIRMVVLEKLERPEDLPASEVEWITLFREEGVDLLNCTDGGDGFHTLSGEARQRMRNSLTGRAKTPEHCANISAGLVRRGAYHRPGMSGKRHTEEARALMSQQRKGRVLSEEHREKLRLANATSPAVAAAREARRGQPLADDHRAAIAAKAKGQWAKLTPEERAERARRGHETRRKRKEQQS